MNLAAPIRSGAPPRWIETSRFSLDWNGPGARAFVPFDAKDLGRPIIALFESAARGHADRIAIDDGRVRLTYREAAGIVHRLAARIAAQIRPGELVGILLPVSVEFPLAMLACLAAGRVFVPLDLHYPRQWLVDVMADAGMSAVIGQFGADVADIVPPAMRKIKIDLIGPVDAAVPRFSAPAIGADDPAIVIYTSGSTGRPKGIVNSQRALLRRVEQYVNAAHINEQDRFLPLSSACTIAGLRERFSALLTGATLHLVDVQRAGVREILRRLRDDAITMIYGVPALLRSLMQLGEGSGLALRVVRVGGDAVLTSDVERLREWLPQDCLIELGYSSTEAPIMQWFVPRDFVSDGAKIPIGYPLAGNSLAIVDEDGSPAREGEIGELVIRSPYVALGRWLDGRCVMDGISPDAREPACRVQHTGDLVRLRSDGLLELIGRKDRQLKIRGNRIEPGEIEAALRRRADVLDAAILPRQTGETLVLIAYVVARTQTCEEGALRQFLRETLPPPLQPHRIHIVKEIPRLPSAKLDIEELRILDRQMQDEYVQLSGANDSASIGATQTAVLAIWQRLLHQPQIDCDADFFDLGGDSLLALELMFEIEEALGVELPVTMIYEYPTVASLSDAIDTHAEPQFSPLVPIRREGEGTPLFIVHGVGGNVMELFALGRQLHAPVYGLQAKGLDGRQEPNRTIGDMADYYLAAIRAVQPSRLYRLAGYSTGGLIAFEMAKRLRAQGEDIALLALLDTQTHARQWPLDVWAAKLWQRAAHHARALGEVSWRRMPRYCVALALSLHRRLTWRLGREGAAPNKGPGIPQALQNVYAATLSAAAAYRPSLYDGAITLLKSEQGNPMMADPARIWKKYARMLQTHIVPGDHYSMIRGEHGRHLAEILNRCLGL
ncbi:MAG TPA: non-ribosomal peptide synthetase [Rhizomicrobium sp.]|nr:non-ribosomal peptide synthetase [Rhizomicrobium sp.]